MSRTDKDVPDWVRENRPEERWGQWHSLWKHTHGGCDIDHVRSRHERTWCGYRLAPGRRWYRDRPARWEVRELYWVPERQAVATALRSLVKQHRSGDIDDSNVPLDQPRRGTYGGGYFD